MKTGYAKQAGSILLAVLLGASGVMGTGCLAFAAEATEAVNEQSELEAELDADAADAEIEITELEITIGEETLIVSNATGIAVEPVSAGGAVEDADGAEDTDSESAENADAETAEAADSETAEGADTESAEDDAAVVLVFTTEDGTVHTFEIADAEELTALTDLTLTEKIGFFFLYGTDGNGDAKYYYETADEITLEEAVTMYTTGQVTVRESADGSSEALGYADRGSELEVLGGTSTWFLITQGRPDRLRSGTLSDGRCGGSAGGS